jgi:hypothetical protein
VHALSIDQHLADFQIEERHSIDVAATPEAAYDVLRKLDFGEIRWFRRLLALRSLPARMLGRPAQSTAITLDALCVRSFVMLDDRRGAELVLGVIGKFWRPIPAFVQCSALEFRHLHPQGYAKAVWNFSFRALPSGHTRITTQTRVALTRGLGRWLFRAYWLAVEPLSGLTRKLILREVQARCSAQHNQLGPSTVT